MKCLLESAEVKCTTSHPGFDEAYLYALVFETAQFQYKIEFASQPIRSQKHK